MQIENTWKEMYSSFSFSSYYFSSDKYLGLLQTAFVVCYMLFAPVFGYLGDRHSRKWLLGIGIGTFSF